MRNSLHILFIISLYVPVCFGQVEETINNYDIVLLGGLVVDPESGLDAVRNVGILNGKIHTISERTLSGDRIINATNLVVAPGFIDLHAHGQDDISFGLMAQDGVTTAFELESGTGDVAAWYEQRETGQLLNYGVSIGHIPVRMLVMGDPGESLPSGVAASEPANTDQISAMAQHIRQGLEEGAVAVGFGIAYTPAAEHKEYETMLQIAAEYGVSSHIHAHSGVKGVAEAITLATKVDAPLHIVHANANGGPDTAEALQLIQDARDQGYDVSTEAYPYGAGMTKIESALFDQWQSYHDDRFQSFQWVATGERLTRESFARYRSEGGSVIIHLRTEDMTRTAIASPLTMIASDGRIIDGNGHPRTSGSYSKVLGKYVREEKLLTLSDAIRKMTIEPARRLQARAAQMVNKGRIKPGADADITVFNPLTVIDRSTYANPTIPSKGIIYVLVNGTIVVDNEKLVTDIRPGLPIRAKSADL